MLLLTEKFRKIYIEKILVELKTLVEEGKVQFQQSHKNINTFRTMRRELGITFEDFKEEIIETIKEIKVENYYQGPDLDDNSDRNLIFWKFGILVFNIEIYLKFDIREIEGKKIVLWSYHIPEYPIIYPFK